MCLKYENTFISYVLIFRVNELRHNLDRACFTSHLNWLLQVKKLSLVQGVSACIVPVDGLWFVGHWIISPSCD